MKLLIIMLMLMNLFACSKKVIIENIDAYDVSIDAKVNTKLNKKTGFTVFVILFMNMNII